MPAAKKKQKPKKIKKPDPFLAWLTHVSLSIGYGVLFMFLMGNIILSQYVPQTYFDLMDSEKNVLSKFFNQGRDIRYFATIFPEMRHTLIAHEDEIFIESDQRQRDILELQRLLELNPQARDILYALSVLHAGEGESELAQEYLKRAREIDPLIGSVEKP